MTTTFVLVLALGLQAKPPADDGQKFAPLAAQIRQGDEAALEQALKALEEGKVTHKPTLVALLNAIVVSGQKWALPRLREMLDKATDQYAKLQLISALGRMGDQKSQGVLIRLGEEKDEPVALAAIQALINLTGRSQIEYLKKMLAHESVQRRLLAADALLQLDVLEGYKVLGPELEKGALAIKVRVIGILGSSRRKESVDLLLVAMEDPEEKVSAPARTTLIRVLAALHPYLRFDGSAPLDKIKGWWKENRPK